MHKLQRLRKKEAKAIIEEMKKYGVELEKKPIDLAEIAGMKILLYDGEPVMLEYNGKKYFTVYGVMKFRPKKWKVMVDEGAMPYIMNGADVMKPGIVYADEGIKAGDFVYITVEGKESPIAVGIALVDGTEMVGKAEGSKESEKGKSKGKAVKNLHHIKDKVWNHFFVKR